MTEKNWFQKQLDIVTERTDKWPNWARREAGLPTFEPSDQQMLDWLEGQPTLTARCVVGPCRVSTWDSTEREWTDGHKGSTLREAIRNAMKAEAEQAAAGKEAGS